MSGRPSSSSDRTDGRRGSVEGTRVRPTQHRHSGTPPGSQDRRSRERLALVLPDRCRCFHDGLAPFVPSLEIGGVVVVTRVNQLERRLRNCGARATRRNREPDRLSPRWRSTGRLLQKLRHFADGLPTAFPIRPCKQLSVPSRLLGWPFGHFDCTRFVNATI